MKKCLRLLLLFAICAAVSPYYTTVIAAPAGIENGGLYNLVARHSGKCLDVFDHGIGNGAHLQQWSCTGEVHQNFRILDMRDGSYELQNVNSGRCVDVAEARYENGSRVHQWECSGNDNQKMRLVPSADGSYTLRFVHSTKCLDVSGPSTDDGAVVHQWDCVGQTNQDWYIRPSSANPGNLSCTNGYRKNWDNSCVPRSCGSAALGSRYVRSVAPASGKSGVVVNTFVCATVRGVEGFDINVFVEDEIYDPLTSESDIPKLYPPRCSANTAYNVYSMEQRSWGTVFDGTCLNPHDYNIPLDLSEFSNFY